MRRMTCTGVLLMSFISIGMYIVSYHDTIFSCLFQLRVKFKAAKSVTFDLLIFEIMFLIFKNTVKKTKIQVYILPIS